MKKASLDCVIEEARNQRPTTPDHLWLWVRRFTGVRISREPVCRGHRAPFDLFARQVLERPSLALWHGPRGSGKSFLSAIDTHLASRFHPRHDTRILGDRSLNRSRSIGPLEKRDVMAAGRMARMRIRSAGY